MARQRSRVTLPICRFPGADGLHKEGLGRATNPTGSDSERPQPPSSTVDLFNPSSPTSGLPVWRTSEHHLGRGVSSWSASSSIDLVVISTLPRTLSGPTALAVPLSGDGHEAPHAERSDVFVRAWLFNKQPPIRLGSPRVMTFPCCE